MTCNVCVYLYICTGTCTIYKIEICIVLYGNTIQMENITLPDEVIKKINYNRIVRRNNIEQEQNKICDKIY